MLLRKHTRKLKGVEARIGIVAESLVGMHRCANGPWCSARSRCVIPVLYIAGQHFIKFPARGCIG
jgi:hypothetical protein